MEAFTLLHDKAVPSAVVALSPAADLALCGAESSLHLIRTMAWQRVFAATVACPASVARVDWAPDGKVAAARDATGTIALLSVESEASVPALRVAGPSTADARHGALPMAWTVVTAGRARRTGAAPLLRVPEDAEAAATMLYHFLPPAPLPPLSGDDVDVALAQWEDDAAATARGVGGRADGGVPDPLAVLAGGGPVLTLDSAAGVVAVAHLRPSVLRGHTCEPSEVLSSPLPPALHVLAAVTRGGGGVGEVRARILAFGTVPLGQHALQLTAAGGADAAGGSGAPLPLSLSLCPQLRSLVVLTLLRAGGVRWGGGALRLSVLRPPHPPPAAGGVPRDDAGARFAAAAQLCVADACVRHTLRSVSFSAAAWRAGAEAPISALLASLEAAVAKFHEETAEGKEGGDGASSLGALRRAAASHYPHARHPLAVAELHRTLIVGASSGAVQHWAETVVGEAGFVRALRAADAAASAVEAACVVHLARSGDSLVACVATLRATAAAAALFGGARGAAPVLPADALRHAAAEAEHALALLELTRGAVAHARATHAAVLTWARLLSRRAAAAAAAAAPVVVDESERGDLPSTVIALQPADADLVLAALAPAAAPADFGRGWCGGDDGGSAAKGDAGNGAVVADPLGLGLGFGGDGDGDVDAALSPPRALAAPTWRDAWAALPKTDALLSVSIFDLLVRADGGGGGDVAAACAATARAPLADDAGPCPIVAAAAAPRFNRSVGAQALALSARLRELVAALDVAGSRGWADDCPLDAPLCDDGGANSETTASSALPSQVDDDRAAVLARSVCAYFDDSWEAGGDGGDQGAHIIALPVAPELTGVGGNCDSDDEDAPRVLLLRVVVGGDGSGGGDPAEHVSPTGVSACLVRLPGGAGRVLGCAAYGAPPGSRAAAAAAAAATVAATAASWAATFSAPPAGNPRGLTVLYGACERAGRRSEGDGDGSTSAADAPEPRLLLAQLSYRDLTFHPLPGYSTAPLALVVAELARGGAAADVVARRRTIPAPPDAVVAQLRLVSSGTGGGAERLAAYAAACAAVGVAASGPRGIAAVSVRGRRVVVLDIEEDEAGEDDAEGVSPAGDVSQMDIDA